MTIEPPTILGSRSVPGISHSTLPTNLAWSEDGQAVFCTSRGVHIFTPYLLSSLPPPPSYLEPESSSTGKRKADGEDVVMDEADDEGGAGPSSSRARSTRRPKNGEVGWYLNGVDVKAVDRTEVYDWTDVGNEYSAIISDDELRASAVAWSPSGLSDVGSCLLAITTNHGQVSIYAPAKDPYTSRWEEIADMTILTRATLPKNMRDPLTIPAMLQMRTTALTWSHAVPLDSYLGTDLSLMALANRAGKVVFWTYGAKRLFEKALSAEVCIGWVTAMAWSPWTEEDQNACVAELALACSDGTIAILHIRQTIQPDASGLPSQKVEIVKDEKVPDPDTRAINGLTWIGDLLVIARPGSITFRSAEKSDTIKWAGTKRVVLSQIGNWAGANPISSCVGIHSIDPNSILVVLSTHIHYIITDILTSPRLGDTATMLNLSIAARQVYFDHVQMDMFENRDSAKQDAYVKSMTAHTGGWAAAGEAGVVAWTAEATNFHNMEAAPEGQRRTTFAMADLGGLLPGRKSAMDALEEMLETPPSLVHSSPLKVLMPHLLRLIAMPDQAGVASELEDLLRADTTAAPLAQARTVVPGEPSSESVILRRSVWGNKALDQLRLRYALARWSAVTYKESAKKFTPIATATLKQIQDIVTKSQLAWAAAVSPKIKDLSQNMSLLQLLLRVAAGLSTPTGFRVVAEAVAKYAPGGKADKTDLCPACGEAVGLGDASGVSRCTKGHEWSRCSITRFLITLPNYRVCSSCPAVSLMPPSCTKPPIPVNDDGLDTDHERAAVRIRGGKCGGVEGMSMADQLLEAAAICVMCGGRWVRVF